jgi:hypothetical protein
MTDHDPMCPVDPPRMDGYCFWCDVIAKARADERERHTVNNPMLLADLRAKVESMAGVHDVWLYRDDVLALIDEACE